LRVDAVRGLPDGDFTKKGGAVGNPSRERIVGGGGDVTDVNAAAIKVEVERVWFAFPEGERR